MDLSVLPDLIELLTDERLAALPRERELGALHLGELVPMLKVVRTLGTALTDLSPEWVPDQVQAHASREVDRLLTVVGELETLRITDQDAQHARGRHLVTVREIRDWFLANVLPLLQVDQSRSLAHLASATAKLSDLHEAQLMAQDAATRANQATAEATNAIAELRKKAGSAGAAQLSAYYSGTAAEAARASKRWLLLSVTATVVVAGTAWALLGALPEGNDWSGQAGALVQRLVVVALASSLLAVAAREYRAARHLHHAMVQRRTALDTYGLFIAAAPDQGTRDLVTAELAKSVFAPLETGFLAGSSERTIVEDQSLVAALLSRRT